MEMSVWVNTGNGNKCLAGVRMGLKLTGMGQLRAIPTHLWCVALQSEGGYEDCTKLAIFYKITMHSNWICHFFLHCNILSRLALHVKQETSLSQRGRAMLHVCQYILASTEQYLQRSFILTYFGFRFTNAYNWMLSCSLRLSCRGVLS